MMTKQKSTCAMKTMLSENLRCDFHHIRWHVSTTYSTFLSLSLFDIYLTILKCEVYLFVFEM